MKKDKVPKPYKKFLKSGACLRRLNYKAHPIYPNAKIDKLKKGKHLTLRQCRILNPLEEMSEILQGNFEDDYFASIQIKTQDEFIRDLYREVLDFAKTYKWGKLVPFKKIKSWIKPQSVAIYVIGAGNEKIYISCYYKELDFET